MYIEKLIKKKKKFFLIDLYCKFIVKKTKLNVISFNFITYDF